MTAMRRPSVFQQRGDQLDTKMTPMIDVVFMLLIFFVWTASFQIVEQDLPSSLLSPAAAAGSAPSDPALQDLEQIVVRLSWIDQRPAWSVNGTPVAALAEVRTRLSAVAQIRRDLPVLVDAVPAIPLANVIDVYDAARLEGFTLVQFAVDE
jgi:biopolymer transport protein ExbD